VATEVRDEQWGAQGCGAGVRVRSLPSPQVCLETPTRSLQILPANRKGREPDLKPTNAHAHAQCIRGHAQDRLDTQTHRQRHNQTASSSQFTVRQTSAHRKAESPPRPRSWLGSGFGVTWSLGTVNLLEKGTVTVPPGPREP
jgi:hypothetical protein